MKKSISAQDTKKIAKDIADSFKKNPLHRDEAVVISLQGELGSGKTTFAQGFAEALHIKQPILSPTFTIVKSYAIPKEAAVFFKTLYHIDCYRLENEKDLLDLEWEAIIADPDNIILLEWPERVQAILPAEHTAVSFRTIGEEEREISM